MPEVHIWPTLAGAMIVTGDTVAFGFFPPEDLGKLQADLESGVPVQKAVGFSGSYCPFSSLSRVYGKKNSQTVWVEARGFLGKDREDFTFLSEAAREEFFETLARLLGPDWERHQGARQGFGALLVPWLLIISGFLILLCGGFLSFLPEDAKRPPAGGQDRFEVGWILLAMGLVAALAGFVWMRLVRTTVFDTLRKKQ